MLRISTAFNFELKKWYNHIRKLYLHNFMVNLNRPEDKMKATRFLHLHNPI
jgi:hypothetical protein